MRPLVASAVGTTVEPTGAQLAGSGIAVDLVLSLLIMGTVFAGLAAAERVTGRWRDRKRRRRLDGLRETGLSEQVLEDLQPAVEYVVRHASPLKPLVALVGAVSLFLLASVSTNQTFLATGYAVTGVVFLVMTGIEVVRFRRARRLRHRLETEPVALASTDEESLGFSLPPVREQLTDWDRP